MSEVFSRQPRLRFLADRSGEPHLEAALANPLHLDIT
jgi:hypothetical protein